MQIKILKKFLLMIIISTLTISVFTNYTLAFDYSKPYETDKNYCFTPSDTNSSVVNSLYFNDDIEIPSEFSLADLMNIPVANQHDLGLCDLFASLKSVETNYALKYGEFIDLSERYLDYMTSKYLFGYREPGVLGENMGDGSDVYTIATIMETIGAPREETVPYKNYTLDEIYSFKNITPVIKATGFVELPYFKKLKNEDQIEYWTKVLKKHIMKYGSVRAAITAPCGNNFNWENGSMYFKQGVTDDAGGHGISIVGWDDNYSKDNFVVKPQNNGAYLCLNSWGEDFGNNGYFWISYEDESINQYSGFVGTKKVPQTYEYTNAQKLFYNGGTGVNETFIGIKFERKSEEEYFSHLTLDAINCYWYEGTSDIPSNDIVKTHYFLNPVDNSFDEDKMILLQTTELDNQLNMGVVLEKPIKIEGENYSIVIQFEEKPESILFYNNVDNDGNDLPIVTYSSTGFGQEWKRSESNIAIFAYTVNKAITKVSMKNPPSKTTYIKGEKLNLDGCIGTIEYDNGDIEEIEFTNENCEISGFDSNKLGTQLVKLNYNGEMIEFNVIVKNEATSIRIKSAPTKLKYAKGETLDLTGGIITISYEDGSTEDISMNSSNFTAMGFDPDKLGEQEIIIHYKELSDSFSITITNELISISLKTKPNKTTYIKGEELDFSGGILTATYEDNTTSEINMDSRDVTYSNYDSNKLGKQTVTIRYKNLTTNIDVIVKNDILGISLKKTPNKLTYIKGENLDFTGGIITVLYEDNTTTDIPIDSSKVTVSGFKPNVTGEQEITIRYNGKTTKFIITVENNEEERPSIPDNTVADKDIPKTGTRIIYNSLIIFAFISISVVAYILNKRKIL